MGYPGEVDAQYRGGERSKETTRSAVVDVLERRETSRERRTCGTVEGWFGTAMNISPAHLFMQYFALAALRRLPLSQPPPPCRPGYPECAQINTAAVRIRPIIYYV